MPCTAPGMKPVAAVLAAALIQAPTAGWGAGQKLFLGSRIQPHGGWWGGSSSRLHLCPHFSLVRPTQPRCHMTTSCVCVCVCVCVCCTLLAPGQEALRSHWLGRDTPESLSLCPGSLCGRRGQELGMFQLVKPFEETAASLLPSWTSFQSAFLQTNSLPPASPDSH